MTLTIGNDQSIKKI